MKYMKVVTIQSKKKRNKPLDTTHRIYNNLMGNQNHIIGIYDKHEFGNYNKIDLKKHQKSANAVDPKSHYYRAVDMYLQEHQKVLKFRSLDEALDKDEYVDSDESFITESDLENSFNEDDPADAVEGVSFREMPQHEDIKYVSPLFRHRYEISIWRVDSYSVHKVKHSYFTPTSDKIDDPKFSDFEMDVSLDRQTLILYEKDSQTVDTLILIFDAYTLDKIYEIDMNTIDDVDLSKYPDYKRSDDFNSPSVGYYCPTNMKVNKFQCWDHGNYL